MPITPTKNFFSYIQSIRRLASIPHTVFFNDRFSTNDHDKANLFNEFFQSVFKSSNIPPPDSSPLPTPPIILDNNSITEADVYVALANLDETKATGPDGTPAQALKYCSCPINQSNTCSLNVFFTQTYLTNGRFIK